MTRLLLLFALSSLTACVPVASKPADSNQAPIGHRVHVREGVHCARCHEKMSEDKGPLHLPKATVCGRCHEKPHADDAYRGRADCLACHQGEEAELALGHLKQQIIFDHAVHLEALQGDCVRCHRNAAHQESERLGALPTMDDCAQCHQEWIDDLRCDACHRTLEAYPMLPLTEQAHRGDFLRRHAAVARQSPERCGQCHDQASCADCHSARAPTVASAFAFDEPTRGFIHRPGFLERHAFEARLSGPSCLGCHSERRCNDCHAKAGRGPGGVTPHGPGWASVGAGMNLHGPAARRDILNCAGCHSGAGGALCAECHAPGRPGGSPHEYGRTPKGDRDRDRPCITCHKM